MIRLYRLLTYFVIATVVLCCVGALIIAFDGSAHEITLPVRQLSSQKDTLRKFAHAAVYGPGEIIIRDPGYVKKVFAPRESLDSLHTLFFFLAVILYLVYFRDFSFHLPFTRKALTGLWIAFWMLVVLQVLDFARDAWFYWEVQNSTNSEFVLAGTFGLGRWEFWFMVILLRFIWIFKKGVALQGETDLTI